MEARRASEECVFQDCTLGEFVFYWVKLLLARKWLSAMVGD